MARSSLAFSDSERRTFRKAFNWSLLGHALGAMIAVTGVGSLTLNEPVVYSVTIEGGATLGGIMQAPPENQTERMVPIVQSSSPPPPTEVGVTKTSTSPDAFVIEEKKNAIEEERRRNAEARKEAAEKKRLADEERRKREVEQRRKAEEERKRREAEQRRKAEEAKKREPTLEQINRELQLATRRYTGESANAGGTGFGAAAIGGRGMGGGVILPREVIEYIRLVELRVKDGWRWFDPQAELTAQVLFQIGPDGTISAIRIVRSSGNEMFDSSVSRAISKANPLPAPPPAAFDHIRSHGGARVTFDPRDL